MKEKTYLLAISGTEHHTWQGVLRAEGEEWPFRSELELLLLLNRRLAEDPPPRQNEREETP